MLNPRPTLFALLLIATVGLPAHGGLYQFNTPHYLIHTDLDDKLAMDLSRRMEAMHSEYSQRLAALSHKSSIPRMEVYLFTRQQDYIGLTGGRARNTGGLFVPGRNFLAAFLEGQGRQQLQHTLQHEAFHQFAYNVISQDLPIWLNEGLAQYFEEGLWNGNGFVLGEVPPRRVRQLRADLKGGRLIAFSTLFSMTDQQWAARLFGDREAGATQYNQTWAMVHFLAMAKDSGGDFLYRNRLLDMLRLLHEGKPGNIAFTAAFGANTQGFQDRFVEYARSLRPTAEATVIENQGVLADMLTDFATHGRRFEDMESFRRYVIRGRFKLHYHTGSLQWDTDPDMNVYFSDLDGNRFLSDDLYFSVRDGAPLPDVVCHYHGTWVLRTRFFDTPSHTIDHDLLIDSTTASAMH